MASPFSLQQKNIKNTILGFGNLSANAQHQNTGHAKLG